MIVFITLIVWFGPFRELGGVMKAMEWPFITVVAVQKAKSTSHSTDPKAIKSNLTKVFKQLLRIQLPYPLLCRLSLVVVCQFSWLYIHAMNFIAWMNEFIAIACNDCIDAILSAITVYGCDACNICISTWACSEFWCLVELLWMYVYATLWFCKRFSIPWTYFVSPIIFRYKRGTYVIYTLWVLFGSVKTINYTTSYY